MKRYGCLVCGTESKDLATCLEGSSTRIRSTSCWISSQITQNQSLGNCDLKGYIYLLLYTQILWPTFGSSSAWPLKSILRKIHRSCNTRCLEALGGIENFFQLILHLVGGRRGFNFSFSTLLFGISHIVYFNCCEKKRIFVFVFVDRFIFFVQNVEETNLYSFIEFLFIYTYALWFSVLTLNMINK